MSSSDDSSSDGGGGGYSNRYSSSSSSSSRVENRGAPSYYQYTPTPRHTSTQRYTPTQRYAPTPRYTPTQQYTPTSRYTYTPQYAPSSSSEDEDEDNGRSSGGDDDRDGTTDAYQYMYDESTSVEERREENNLNQGTSDSRYPPDLRGNTPHPFSPSFPAEQIDDAVPDKQPGNNESGAKLGSGDDNRDHASGSLPSDSIGNEHPPEGGMGGGQDQLDGLAGRVDFPASSDRSSSIHGSGDELEPGETPMPANGDPNHPEWPPLMLPRPAPESGLENMPHFEDNPGESPPGFSVPERGHDKPEGGHHDEDSPSDHSTEGLGTPDGEWIGLDPTVGHGAQRRWSDPEKKKFLVSRWGVHLRRGVPSITRLALTSGLKTSFGVVSSRGLGHPVVATGNITTGPSVPTNSTAQRILAAAQASLPRPPNLRLPSQARMPEFPDPGKLLGSLKERKLLTDGIALAERVERETTLQPVYTFDHSGSSRPTATPIYSALLGKTSFRILHLLPSTDLSSPVLCRLTVEDLTNRHLQYEAVSYTWGTPHPRHMITCNGNPQGIGPSLYSLLLRLRLATEPRALWADAICIDQSNDIEKGHQVRLMQRIYLTAARVVIWLGEEPPETGYSAMAPAACKAVCRLAGAWSCALHKEIMPRPAYRIGGRQYRLSAREMRDVAPDERQEWAAIRALFRKEYWERLWVVQEVTSSTAAVVRWCDVEIPWTWVGIAACLIRHSHEKSTRMIDEADLRGVHNACLMFWLPDEEWAETPFLHLMRVLLRFKVTNQHDRAYAILGLPGLHTGDASSMGELFVQPDYGLSLHDLYVALAQRIVDTHENPLDLLSAVKHDDRAIDPSLPSWVPRWNVTVVRSINGSHRPGMRFHAGGTSPPHIRPSCHRRATDGRLLLTALGHIIGTVAKAAALSATEGPGLASGWGPAAQLLCQWQCIGLGPNEVDMDDPTVRALCMTMTAGQDWYGRLIDTDEAERQHFADFGAFASERWKREWTWRRVSNLNKAEHEPCAERFALAVRNVCQQRSIFRSGDGTLGIGPMAVRSGDVICVLQGGSVPYVLRPVLDNNNNSGSDTKEGYYWLVGECYLEGYMFGEALGGVGIYTSDAAGWDLMTLL